MKRIALYIILLLCCHVLASAQDHEYFQYTVKDGLPTNHVYGVIEDEEGNIWAYTENGMAKFDGYEFQVYNTKNGLPTNDIVHAIRDDDGRMWLWAYNGPPTYIYKDSIHIVGEESCGFIYKMDNKVRYVCRESGHILEMENGRPSIVKMGNEFLFDHEELFQLDSVRYHPNGEQGQFGYLGRGRIISQVGESLRYYSNNRAVYIYMLDDGYLLVDSQEKIVYRKKNGLTKSMQIGQVNKEGEIVGIDKVGLEERFLLRYMESKKMILIDFEDEKWKWMAPFDSLLLASSAFIHSINENTFSVDGQNGYLSYDFNGDLTDQLRLSDLPKQFFLQRFYKDQNQNIWIGSREGGVIMIPAENRKTQLLTSRFSTDQSFEQLLKTKDGRLLAFTDNSGVYEIKGKKIIQKYFPEKGGRLMDIVETKEGVLVSSSTSSFLIPYQNGQLIFFKEKRKLFAKARNTIEHQFLNQLFGQKLLVYDSIQQNIYTSFSQSHQLNQYQLKSAKEIYYTDYPIKNISAMFYDDRQGQLYLGTNQGVLSLKNEKIDTVLIVNEKIKSITSLEMVQDQLWMGTASNGLWTYDIQSATLNSILDASYIRRIRPDTDSTVLVCTNEGLFIVHTTTQKIVQEYSTKDGIPINEIQDVYAEGDTYIYVATTNGIALVDRQMKTPVSLSSHDLQMDQVLINNEVVGLQNTYDFSYQENNLKLDYHLRSYASNGEIQYYSKLEPLQKEWEKSKKRSATYYGLNSGKYSFHLKAEDIYGNEVSLENPLQIKIRKAYWQTNWFRILSIFLLGGGLIYFLTRREVIQKEAVEKEKQLNRRMATLELSALKAQMNPHFVFNALGAIQYYIQVHEVEAADAYLTRFAQLMRRFLDSSKEKLISLKDEIALLRIYTDLEKMRFESLFTVDIIVEKGLGLEDHYLPSMMIQPFIENAVNHGLSERRDGKGALTIFFYEKEEVLHCEIKDNGIGRENAKKAKRKGHLSRGMSIIQEKIQTLKISGLADIQLHIQDLDPSKQQYPGTQIILTLKTIEDDEN